jgi:two-component system, OmpR family, alkaline phosphatase synthesis response regulator PhoP
VDDDAKDAVMGATILVVDDEPQLVRVLRGYLEQAGYRVVAAHAGPEAMAQFQSRRPDLVLLDLNLPGMDGFEVARAIRRQGNTPIIMLTARVEETDRLIGLELGADDYVPKPFSPREVVARVRAVLRRSQAPHEAVDLIRIGDVEISVPRHTVARGTQPVELTPTEFNLLVTLAREPGRAFSRMQLLEAAQGDAFEGYERTIDAHIKNLRAKLEPEPRQPRYILTVFGVGYKFTEG